jgi:hypothetical protein
MKNNFGKSPLINAYKEIKKLKLWKIAYLYYLGEIKEEK